MKVMVGFDVAKNTVVGAVVDSSFMIRRQPELLANTESVLREWLRAVRQALTNDTAVSSTVLSACCESTSYYHYTIVRICAELGIPCVVLNPIVTKQATKATIRGKKTDVSDAILIAKLGLRGEGALTTNVGSDSKVLLRTSVKLQETVGQLKLLRQSLDERYVVLPMTSHEAYENAIMQLDTVIHLWRQTAASYLDSAILDLMATIPGIGRLTAATLVAEITDISQFSSADKLIAFAGFDPRVRQSGESLHRNTKLTKRGSPTLRRAVFIAANVSRRWDADLQSYYKQKTGQGRTYTEAMMPICRKLLKRVYAVWKRRTPYVKTDTTTQMMHRQEK